jgi:hypothetical protein
MTLSFIVCALLGTPLAHAQATRTWVSGVGDDVNPCSRTAPCKTFAGAISKTAAGGEISVLDPGPFGSVSINKSLTINGDGSLAGILATGAGVSGVTVNAGAADVVILRNLSINGAGTGTNGIRYIGGGMLVVDRCTVYGFTNGINVLLGASGRLVVENSSIEDSTKGVLVNKSGGTPRIDVTMNHVSIRGNTNGIENVHGFTSVTDGTVSQNSGFGVLASGGAVTVENSMLTSNGTAIQVNTGATIRLSNNGVYDNQLGFVCNGGILASAGNNRKGNNTGGAGTPCAPNAAINVQ